MAPEDVRCAPLTSQSLQVSWQPPPTEHCNGLLQGYKLTYEPVLDDNSRGTCKHRGKFVLSKRFVCSERRNGNEENDRLDDSDHRTKKIYELQLASVGFYENWRRSPHCQHLLPNRRRRLVNILYVYPNCLPRMFRFQFPVHLPILK